jgi:DNA adenine methylase
MSRSVFPYYGGKTRYAPRLIELMPDHRVYVEPFGGSASVLLSKPQSYIEVLNDHDEHVVTFFRVLRNRREDLEEWLDAAPYARATHHRWTRQFYGDDPLPADLSDVQLAGRWFTLRHTQYASSVAGVSGFSTPGHRSEASALRANVDRLDDVAERFSEVHLECDDWQAVVCRYDETDAFHYLDPPYVGNEADYGVPEFDHTRLVDCLAQREGYWMLSYRELPEALAPEPYHLRTLAGRDTAAGSKDATERVVMNYDPEAVDSFEGPQRGLSEFQERGTA